MESIQNLIRLAESASNMIKQLTQKIEGGGLSPEELKQAQTMLNFQKAIYENLMRSIEKLNIPTPPEEGWKNPEMELALRRILSQQPADGDLHFNNNQWTGYVNANNFDENGQMVTFSPLPPSASAMGGLLLAGALAKLLATENGQKLFRDIVLEYLRTVRNVLGELHNSSVASPMTAIINNYTVIGIYKRLGLLAPKDELQCRAWSDHVMGELLLSSRLEVLGDAMKGLTTLTQKAVTHNKGK